MNRNSVPPTSVISAAILTGCVVFGFKLGRMYPADQPLEIWSLIQAIIAMGLLLFVHEITRGRIEYLTMWVRVLLGWQRLPYWWRTNSAAFAFTARTIWAWVQVVGLAGLGFIHFLWRAVISDDEVLKEKYDKWLAAVRVDFGRRTEEAGRKWLTQGAGKVLARQLLRQAAANAEKVGDRELATRLRSMADHIKDG